MNNLNLDLEDNLPRKKRSRYRLKNIEVNEVSLVDFPAINRKFCLFKSMENEVDLSDADAVAEISEEWENMNSEQQAKILAEIERCSVLLEIVALESFLKKLEREDNWTFHDFCAYPEKYDLDLEAGTITKKPVAKSRPGSESKTHVFNFESGKWIANEGRTK